MDGRLIDLTGKRVGRLLVLRRHLPIIPQIPKWICLCDCGNETVVQGADLRRKPDAPKRHRPTQSCGCLNREILAAHAAECKGKPGPRRTHNLTRSPEWHSWIAMRARCRDPRDRKSTR